MTKNRVFIEDLSGYSVCSYCRKLLREGHDPSESLDAYRKNGTLCLIVKNIGRAAELTVHETNKGPMFVKWRPFEGEM